MKRELPQFLLSGSEVSWYTKAKFAKLSTFANQCGANRVSRDLLCARCHVLAGVPFGMVQNSAW